MKIRVIYGLPCVLKIADVIKNIQKKTVDFESKTKKICC